MAHEGLSKEEVTKKINAFTDAAYTALKSAEMMADLYGHEFHFNPAYGMGGTYRPNPALADGWENPENNYLIKRNEDDDGWKHAYTDNSYPDDDEGYWASSSSSC